MLLGNLPDEDFGFVDAEIWMPNILVEDGQCSKEDCLVQKRTKGTINLRKYTQRFTLHNAGSGTGLVIKFSKNGDNKLIMKVVADINHKAHPLCSVEK